MTKHHAGPTPGDSTEIFWQSPTLSMPKRWSSKGHLPALVWLTGLSASGKSTIAHALDEKLHHMRFHTAVLDGENLRHGLNRDLGFSEDDRTEACRRLAEVAKVSVQAGLITIVSCISPLRIHREHARNLLPDGLFYEVFVDTPLSVCIERDPKSLYGRAQKGEIKQFTGIHTRYEVPLKPDLRLDTAGEDLDGCVQQVVDLLLTSGVLDRRSTSREVDQVTD